MNTQYTPGPWRWEFNAKHRNVHLVGGSRPQFDLTIIDFCRWGMHGATMRLRDTAHDGMNIMHDLHKRPDWIAPEPGREHHKSWHQLVTHPDARLIEAAPDLLEACKSALGVLIILQEKHPELWELNSLTWKAGKLGDMLGAAIAKAEGSAA
jgi:hypothetical protein